MRKLLSIIFLTALLGCQYSSKEPCRFTNVDIQIHNGEELLSSFKETTCITEELIPKAMGLMEITDTAKAFSISYYWTGELDGMDFLNVRFGEGEPYRFRLKQGDFIARKSELHTSVISFKNKKGISGVIKLN